VDDIAFMKPFSHALRIGAYFRVVTPGRVQGATRSA
jgi:hypothetical protein